MNNNTTQKKPVNLISIVLLVLAALINVFYFFPIFRVHLFGADLVGMGYTNFMTGKVSGIQVDEGIPLIGIMMIPGIILLILSIVKVTKTSPKALRISTLVFALITLALQEGFAIAMMQELGSTLGNFVKKSGTFRFQIFLLVAYIVVAIVGMITAGKEGKLASNMQPTLQKAMNAASKGVSTVSEAGKNVMSNVSAQISQQNQENLKATYSQTFAELYDLIDRLPYAQYLNVNDVNAVQSVVNQITQIRDYVDTHNLDSKVVILRNRKINDLVTRINSRK